jgi:peptide-methionine (R)-S-oxide reductase
MRHHIPAMMTRRTLLFSAAAAVAVGLSVPLLRRGEADGAGETFEVTLTDAEWRKKLTERQYAVLRHESTEPPFSSDLLDEKRSGIYACAGCDLDLYPSAAKFDSGTGWPSFWEALPDAVRTRSDFSLLLPRTELHCRRCGGHLGHVFDDGPPPTGKRHCINGVALKFREA